jgi:hypothetical protein
MFFNNDACKINSEISDCTLEQGVRKFEHPQCLQMHYLVTLVVDEKQTRHSHVLTEMALLPT